MTRETDRSEAVRPFVVRRFEGRPWVPLHEAARLHDAVQASGLTIAALRNALALRPEREEAGLRKPVFVPVGQERDYDTGQRSSWDSQPRTALAAPVAGLDVDRLKSAIWRGLQGDIDARRAAYASAADIAAEYARLTPSPAEEPEGGMEWHEAATLYGEIITALASARMWLVGEYANLPRSEFNAEAWQRLADRVGGMIADGPGWMNTARTYRLRSETPEAGT